MEVNQGNDLSAEKELRKKRLDELRRKRELKKAAMDGLSRGAGAVSAGPSSFARETEHSASQAINVNSLPSRNQGNKTQVPPLPSARPVRSTTERRMPGAEGQTLEKPINKLGTSRVKTKYALVSDATTARPSTRNTKKLSSRTQTEKYLMYLERGAWIFCLILFVRLVFADRGIVEYYQRESNLAERQRDYLMISDSNQGLIKEIGLLKKSKGHQKKTIREHLGFIARDEYLVLVE